MVLLSLYGETLQLVPIGRAGDRLDIQVNIWTPTGTWSRTAPFLDAAGVRTLVEWLRGAADGAADAMLDFDRPGLSFEFVMGDPERLIRVATEWGTINLMVSRRSLTTAADDLEAEAAALPPG